MEATSPRLLQIWQQLRLMPVLVPLFHYKPEDDSAAAIDDCDDDEVEQAGFDCIAIAANDVEIEPPEEESATLSVCKTTEDPNFSPEDFDFTVTGNNPSPAVTIASVCFSNYTGSNNYKLLLSPLQRFQILLQ
jgi:hypothetical protein